MGLSSRLFHNTVTRGEAGLRTRDARSVIIGSVFDSPVKQAEWRGDCGTSTSLVAGWIGKTIFKVTSEGVFIIWICE